MYFGSLFQRVSLWSLGSVGFFASCGEKEHHGREYLAHPILLSQVMEDVETEAGTRDALREPHFQWLGPDSCSSPKVPTHSQ